jgi:hypothetical protein
VRQFLPCIVLTFEKSQFNLVSYLKSQIKRADDRRDDYDKNLISNVFDKPLCLYNARNDPMDRSERIRQNLHDRFLPKTSKQNSSQAQATTATKSASNSHTPRIFVKFDDATIVERKCSDQGAEIRNDGPMLKSNFSTLERYNLLGEKMSNSHTLNFTADDLVNRDLFSLALDETAKRLHMRSLDTSLHLNLKRKFATNFEKTAFHTLKSGNNLSDKFSLLNRDQAMTSLQNEFRTIVKYNLIDLVGFNLPAHATIPSEHLVISTHSDEAAIPAPSVESNPGDLDIGMQNFAEIPVTAELMEDETFNRLFADLQDEDGRALIDAINVALVNETSNSDAAPAAPSLPGATKSAQDEELANSGV